MNALKLDLITIATVDEIIHDHQETYNYLNDRIDFNTDIMSMVECIIDTIVKTGEDYLETRDSAVIDVLSGISCKFLKRRIKEHTVIYDMADAFLTSVADAVFKKFVNHSKKELKNNYSISSFQIFKNIMIIAYELNEVRHSVAEIPEQDRKWILIPISS